MGGEMRKRIWRSTIFITISIWVCFFNYISSVKGQGIDSGKVNEIRDWLNLSESQILSEVLSKKLNLKYQGGPKTYYDYFKTQIDTIENGKKSTNLSPET